MQRTLTLILLIFNITNSIWAFDRQEHIDAHAGKTVHISHEIAINHMQLYISFWEIIKQQFAFLGYGKKQLTYISAILLAASLLPSSDISTRQREACIGWAFLLHAPRGILALWTYVIDHEIGFLRQQVERLSEESERGIQLNTRRSRS